MTDVVGKCQCATWTWATRSTMAFNMIVMILNLGKNYSLTLDQAYMFPSQLKWRIHNINR